MDLVGPDLVRPQASRELLELQTQVLARAAAGTDARDLLPDICRMIEDEDAGTTCTILLVEGSTLRHGGAPGMPQHYVDAIDGLVWGPDRGSCGTTVHTGRPTLVADIATDPKWVDFKDLALGIGMRACWSVPVLARNGEVLATFASYCTEARMPTRAELDLLEHAANLLTVLLEQQRDRDRLRAMALDLEETNRELVAASRAKDDFLSMTSHELRTPLTPMIGMIETLQARWDVMEDDARRSLLDVIGRQAARMGHLVDDLLTMSAASAGELRAHPEEVQLQDAVHLAIAGMVGPDAVVATDVQERLAVRVDPAHLQQMLQNYLSNAVKYAEGGPRFVRARRDGDRVTIAVVDTGAGVPGHLAEQLFEPFRQLDSGDRRTARGTGIGLAVVRALADLNGGIAWHEPTPGGGATFAIALPVAG